MHNILLVEDNRDIQAVNKKMLDKPGIYNVRLAMNLAEAREVLATFLPEMIVLDIMLPDGSGLDFLKELREERNVPVLLLTALGTPEDIVKGLKSGGDDYLPKPYDYNVLLARIEALLNRAGRIPEAVTKGKITLRMSSGEAFFDGENLNLSHKEFALLAIFMQNEDKIMRAEYLYEQVWGQEMLGDTAAIKNTVYKLRKKLAGSGFTVSAERGGGYYFERE